MSNTIATNPYPAFGDTRYNDSAMVPTTRSANPSTSQSAPLLIVVTFGTGLTIVLGPGGPWLALFDATLCAVMSVIGALLLTGVPEEAVRPP